MKIQTIVHTLWPIQCTLCDLPSNNNHLICDDCRSTLPYCTSSCTRCGLPLSQHQQCSECINDPSSFDHTVALFEYKAPISTLITHYKFNGDLRIANILAREWID